MIGLVLLSIFGSTNVIYLGSQPELIYAEAGKANREWTDTFGTIYRMQTCFGVSIGWLCGRSNHSLIDTAYVHSG